MFVVWWRGRCGAWERKVERAVQASLTEPPWGERDAAEVRRFYERQFATENPAGC